MTTLKDEVRRRENLRNVTVMLLRAFSFGGSISYRSPPEMRDDFSRDLPEFSHQLLAPVDVEGRAGQRGIGHEVDGEGGHVRGPDDPADGERRP
jgi:hypothetical protein